VSERQRTVTIATDDELPVSQAVLETIADATATDAMNLPPLYRAVDPEALDALLVPRGSDDGAPVTLAFDYHDCQVTVEREDEDTVTISVATGPE
jgi:hypothetical protein